MCEYNYEVEENENRNRPLEDYEHAKQVKPKLKQAKIISKVKNSKIKNIKEYMENQHKKRKIKERIEYLKIKRENLKLKNQLEGLNSFALK